MMITIGLTGSMATGKTTIAKMFQDAGIEVFDSDKCVHDIYSNNIDAITSILKIIPEAAQNGHIDRDALSRAIQEDPSLLNKVERIIHPIVKKHRDDFLAKHQNRKYQFVILDIPLLFELGLDEGVNTTLLVTAPKELQDQRALARPGMNLQKLSLIRSKQWPDDKKIAKADLILSNSGSIDQLSRQVAVLIKDLKEDYEYS